MLWLGGFEPAEYVDQEIGGGGACTSTSRPSARTARRSRAAAPGSGPAAIRLIPSAIARDRDNLPAWSRPGGLQAVLGAYQRSASAVLPRAHVHDRREREHGGQTQA